MKEFLCKTRNARNLTSFKTRMLFTLVMKFHDRQSSERCIRKLISRHCLEKTRTRWNDFLFLITDDRDFRPQTCTNGLVFRECKHIKNIFEDVYFLNKKHASQALCILQYIFKLESVSMRIKDQVTMTLIHVF